MRGGAGEELCRGGKDSRYGGERDLMVCEVDESGSLETVQDRRGSRLSFWGGAVEEEGEIYELDIVS